MNKRPSAAQRLSEICDSLNSNKNRGQDGGNKLSFIPRPSGRSLERVSGVHPFESSGGNHFQVPHTSGGRHRSADSNRMTQLHSRNRSESAQRPSTHQSRSRNTFMPVRETPSQRTPLARQLLQTPMSAMAGCRPRTPSAERQRGRLSALQIAILSMPGKDNRKISDPIWQKKTSAQLIAYLKEHPQAYALLPNVNNPLRPITIKLFVDLVNCLLGLPNHINTGNYTQKLPITARKILYPGVMTKSWLKAVNTMHNYPNMLAFLSYLVDFSRIRDITACNMSLSKVSGEEKKGPIATMKQQYYLDCWKVYQIPGETFEPNLNAYIDNLKEIYGVADGGIMKVNEQITELMLQTANPSLVTARNQEAALKARPAQLEEQARQLRQTRADLERRLRQELHQQRAHKDLVEKGREETHRLELEIQEVQQGLVDQRMTVRQRDDILNEVETILTAVESKNELLNSIQKMGYTKDLELGQLQKQALKACTDLNRSLVAVGLSAGSNLNDYTIDERDLLAGNSIEDNLKRTEAILVSIKTKFEERLQQARHNKEVGVCRKQQVKIELESERQCVSSLQSELAAAEQELRAAEASAADKVARQRSDIQSIKQRTTDKRRRAADMLTEARDDRAFWDDQDEKWRTKLEQLRGEEDLVRKTCEARAQALIGEYLALAKTVVEKGSKLQTYM